MLELVNIKKAFNPGTINEKKALNEIGRASCRERV